ncbi:MAG: alpha-galactosidase [Lachnospiraceae bacterium]|nr:alpha-galactosidase [Lachnospiraceae bacterium]
MALFIENDGKLFRLVTSRTEYQMSVDRHSVLRHLWYGQKVGVPMDYLQEEQDVGFSGSPYDAGNDRAYSLDTAAQECPADGTGDYRISAIKANGGIDLRFSKYSVVKETVTIPGLPAAFGDAETLEITLIDDSAKIAVTLRYGVFEDLDLITRSAEIANCGDAEITLEKAASLSLDLPAGDWEWIHFPGRHTMERQPNRASLFEGIQESGSTRGTSSHQQNPAFILCEKNCTETNGLCIGGTLLYSGSFQTAIEKNQLEQVRITIGIHPDLFRWRLRAGGRFYTPQAAMSLSADGFEKLSHNFHRFIREHVTRGKFSDAPRPVLLNSWEAAYFDFDEEKLLSIAKEATTLGVELFVLDDGWFGRRNDDCSSLGDWFVNRDKLPHGLDGLAKSLNALGLKMGLWFEPECISEKSELYRKHPDWIIAPKKRKPVRGRYQLVLNLSRKEVENYLFDTMAAILSSANIAYVKWDMNRSLCDFNDGEQPHRYILGLYSLLERLTAAFPDMLFEGCSGGGGRFDAGMLYYTPQIWCSDDTDAVERTKIQFGTSFFYPASSMGSHVSAVPNHQTGRVTPLETRGVVATAGRLGYELDPRTLSENEKNIVRAQIKHYKSLESLIHGGKYYRLTDPTKENVAAWMFTDGKHVLAQGVQFHTMPNTLRQTLRLRGLEAKAHYRVEETGQILTGSALMCGGLLLPRAWGDFNVFEILLTKEA